MSLLPIQRSDDGQLMYIELEFDPNRRAATGAAVNRRSSPTEYVGIDFAKTMAYTNKEDDNPTTENIYANQ